MFSLTMLIIAFGSGIFAAAIGALAAFIFCGFAGLIGVAIILSGGPDTILNQMAFGVFFGPHISFAAAVAAAAYAGRKKLLDSGSDIVTPLIKFNDVSVLLVGGLFGSLGYVLQLLFSNGKLTIDTVGLTVLVSAVIARFLFGKTGLFGKYEDKNKKREFLPDIKSFAYIIVQAFGLGIVISYFVGITHISTIGFLISAASLVILQMGFAFPVTHHITLIAGYATMATGNLWIGTLFAVIAALVGEVIGRTINSFSDSHIDPPATTIALLSLVIFTFIQR